MAGGYSTVALPWPPRELHPNARPHHMQRARAAKAYRTVAFWAAEMAGVIAPTDGEVMLSVTFNPPDNRKRDLDGMFAASKAGFDGIADALQVNDYRFAFTIRRAEPLKGGKVVIAIGEGANG